MRVAIRPGRSLLRRVPAAGRNRRAARAGGAALGAACLLAASFCVWRWSFDLGLARSFPFTGTLGKWQAWFGLALASGVAAAALLGGARRAR